MTTRISTFDVPQNHAYIDPATGAVVVTVGGWILGLALGLFGVFAIFAKRLGRFFKRNWKPTAALLVLLAAVGGGLYYWSTLGPSSDFEGRIYILGFDGFDAATVDRLMADGDMPNFQRLAERGDYRHLRTSNPAESPAAWGAFSTGKNPGKHGVYDFLERDPANYTVGMSITKIHEGEAHYALQAPGWFEIAGELGVPSTVLALPGTFPPPAFNGRMLSGMGTPDILGTSGMFTFFTSEPVVDKDVGGIVVQVRPAPTMKLNLQGPKVLVDDRPEPVKVPLTVKLRPDGGVDLSLQDQQATLPPQTWSDWLEVEFDLGFLSQARGLVRFYLVATEPDFKLYVSPVNIHPADPFWPITWPRDYGEELFEALGPFYTQGMPMETWGVNEGRIDDDAFLAQVALIEQERDDQIALELERFDAGIFYAYYEDPDIVQHMMWRYIDPQHPLYDAEAPARFRSTIDDWYRRYDAKLGEFMDRIDLANDTLIVLSDHGFGSFRRAVHLNTWLLDNGYLVLKDPQATAVGELFGGVDWDRTRAYAAGFGGIFVNQQGREARGIVKPGAETEALKAELSEALGALTDAASAGTSVVRRVFAKEEIFWGPHAAEQPDLYVGFQPGYRASWQTALGAGPDEAMIVDNLKAWSGTHLFDPETVPGVLFTNRQITADSPHLMDLAPSILKLAGVPEDVLAAQDFDGQVVID